MSSADLKKSFLPPSSSPRYHLRKRSRLCSDRARTTSAFRHGIVFSHYSIQDRSAEAYAMVQLFESGYADQNDIARCFGYSARTLRRYQERLKVGGLSALARPRGRPRKERIEKFRRYVNTTRAAVFVAR